MIDDFKNSIQKILNERIMSPFSGSFFFAWFVWNWRMLYVLRMSRNREFKGRWKVSRAGRSQTPLIINFGKENPVYKLP
jgi:hypothetical protein